MFNVRTSKEPSLSSAEYICAMSCTIAFDQLANHIQDLGSYDGPEINYHLVLTMINNKAHGANHLVDQQSVSHRIIGSNYLTQSCLQIEQSDLDQDDVKMVILEISNNCFIKQVIVSSNIAGRKAVNGSANQNQLFVLDGRKAVNGSANQNLPNHFMKSWFKIMPGERRGIHFIQHNTNDTATGEKPAYMPPGLAFSTDVDYRNKSKDSNQATMNNMAWSTDACGGSQTTSHPSRQQPRSTARLLLLHLHSDGAMNTPMIVTLTQHIIFLFCAGRARGPYHATRGPTSQCVCTACSLCRLVL